MKIYQICEGPIHSSDLEEYDDDANIWVVYALVENTISKALEEEAIEFDNYKTAYALVDHFKQQIIPYSIDWSMLYD